MNAIEKYINVLQSENNALLWMGIILFAICIVELFFVTKFSDELNRLTTDNESLQKENDQLKEDLVKERKKNTNIHKIELERDLLKTKLAFVLKNPPKFPIGTKVGNSQVNKIDIVIPGIVSYSVYAIRRLFGLKSDKPVARYLYYMEDGGEPLHEDHIELLKSVITKKSTKNGKKSN